jgi:hypothetical protein
LEVHCAPCLLDLVASWISLLLQTCASQYSVLKRWGIIHFTRFAITFGCLTIKIVRVIQFLKEKTGYPRVNDYILLQGLIYYLGLWVALLAIFRLIRLPEPIYLNVYEQTKLITPNEIKKSYLYECHLGSLDALKLTFQGLSIALALVAIFYTRLIDAPYKESVWTYILFKSVLEQ